PGPLALSTHRWRGGARGAGGMVGPAAGLEYLPPMRTPSCLRHGLALVLLCSACESAPDDAGAEPPLRAGCNPLGGGPGEDCFLPFPSSFYTQKDTSTRTGLRVHIPDGVLPASRQGKPI